MFSVQIDLRIWRESRELFMPRWYQGWRHVRGDTSAKIEILHLILVFDRLALYFVTKQSFPPQKSQFPMENFLENEDVYILKVSRAVCRGAIPVFNPSPPWKTQFSECWRRKGFIEEKARRTIWLPTEIALIKNGHNRRRRRRDSRGSW